MRLMRFLRAPRRGIGGSAAPCVAVGLSGGVDSAVSAMLLQRQGYRVIGVHMSNWDHRDETGMCPGERDARDCEDVCAQLRIPLHRVSFEKEYWQLVFQRMLSEYARGVTPNPDALCNREIKFSLFLDFAFGTLGADLVATGHYARLRRSENGGVQLLRATDPAKDQTFFLSLVRPGSLSRVLFPVGELAKAEVRQLAAAAALSVARKRESMGVCFVGKRRSFADFLREYLPEQRPAPFLHVETGAPLRDSPQHRGAVFYTAGQRALIGNMAEPFYVARTSVAENAVWVAPGAHHPALFVREFHVDGESWLSGAAPFPHGGTLACSLRIHHRDPLRACSLSRLADGALRVELAAPASEVALGQTIAFYDGEVCLGGAQVRARGPSLYELGAWDSDALRALVGSSIAYKAQLRQAAAAAAAAAAGATPL